jgi:xanthine dehydrogenase YagS FAD-binding subunit
MQPFKYVRVSDEARAIDAVAPPNARFIAGGTLLVDLMKLGVETPAQLVDVNGVPLDKIEKVAEGLKIGAMSRNSDLANHPIVKASFPVLSEALLSGASPQLRNLATLGGNLMQRPRCAYFRDLAYPDCNKRKPGSGCAAMNGWTRMHAILGTTDKCIAAHPSDMCVALVALDASVFVTGPKGSRTIPIADFHVVPADKPEVETVLGHGEMITHVVVPDTAFAKRSRYVKARDRASYAFALASAAVALDLQGGPGGTIKQARVALGGLSTKPWRSKEAEQKLEGQKATADVFRAAAEAALAGAAPRRDNAFKVELGKRTIVRALELAGGAA